MRYGAYVAKSSANSKNAKLIVDSRVKSRVA